MSEGVEVRHGVAVVICGPDGPMITSEQDALDLIGTTYGHDAALVAVPAHRLGSDFFDLSTRIAGGIVQKFVNYQVRLAVIGDISEHLAASSALRAFVLECNRADQVWFVDDLEQLDARLLQQQPSANGRPRH